MYQTASSTSPTSPRMPLIRPRWTCCFQRHLMLTRRKGEKKSEESGGWILFWSIEDCCQWETLRLCLLCGWFSQHDCRCKVVGLQRRSYFWFWSTDLKPFTSTVDASLYSISLRYSQAWMSRDIVPLIVFGQKKKNMPQSSRKESEKSKIHHLVFFVHPQPDAVYPSEP